MNFKKNYKAPILGAVLIACGLYVILIKETYNETMIAGLLISGVLLFFVPNKFINVLEKFVLGRVLIDKSSNNTNE